MYKKKENGGEKLRVHTWIEEVENEKRVNRELGKFDDEDWGGGGGVRCRFAVFQGNHNNRKTYQD